MNKEELNNILNTLSIEDLDSVLSIIDEYLRFGYFDYIMSTLEEMKSKIKDKINIEIDNLSLNNIDDVVENIKNNQEKFKRYASKLIKILELIDLNIYNDIYLSDKNGKLSNLMDLSILASKIEETGLIKQIDRNKEKLKKLFINKHEIEKLNRENLAYQKSLLNKVNNFIIFNYEISKEDLGINIDKYKNSNLSLFYLKLKDAIDNKNEQYNDLIKYIKNTKYLLCNVRNSFLNKINKINDLLYNYLSKNNIDINELKSEVANIIKVKDETNRAKAL